MRRVCQLRIEGATEAILTRAVLANDLRDREAGELTEREPRGGDDSSLARELLSIARFSDASRELRYTSNVCIQM